MNLKSNIFFANKLRLRKIPAGNYFP